MGTIEVSSSFNELDADAQFADTGALSGTTRVNLRSWYLRAGHNTQVGNLEVRSFAAYSSGNPGGNDVVLPVLGGQPTSERVERDFGYRALSAGVDGPLRPVQPISVVGRRA